MRRIAWIGAVLMVALAAAGCGGQSTEMDKGGDTTLTLVAYSTPREVYEQLTEDFAATSAGKEVSFDESYAASGEQSRAVTAGLPADVVAFSLEPDVTRLVAEGLVAADWKQDEFGGMVSQSVVVLAVRKGNPKGIRGWADLTARASK